MPPVKSSVSSESVGKVRIERGPVGLLLTGKM